MFCLEVTDKYDIKQSWMREKKSHLALNAGVWGVLKWAHISARSICFWNKDVASRNSEFLFLYLNAIGCLKCKVNGVAIFANSGRKKHSIGQMRSKKDPNREWETSIAL